MGYLKTTASRFGKPSQLEQEDEKQVKNSAGGYSFVVSNWTRLERFLILGSEGGSYYATEQKLTMDNAKAVVECIKEDGLRVVNKIVEVSKAGRAPKNDSALFALALCAAKGSPEVKHEALIVALPKVARIGTHLFHFISYVESMRGWSRQLRTAVSNWYLQFPDDELQNQLVKYQARDGWSHRDLLRLAHPKAITEVRQNAFAWTVGKPSQLESLKLISGFEKAKALGVDQKSLENMEEESRKKKIANHVKANETKVVELISTYELTREMIPTEFLSSKVVWEALFEKMPMTAMIRNLANITRIGLMDSVSKEVGHRLHNMEMLKKARVHPIQLLIAMKTYEAGKGNRSKGEGWTPNQRVVDALDDAFYLSFGLITPTDKRWFLGVDVSSSMTMNNVAGVEGLTPNICAAALALVTAKTEQDWEIKGFTDTLKDLGISPKDKLTTAMKKTQDSSFGGTDCALPIVNALSRKLPIDVFCILTDNETWAGRVHPHVALRDYRQKMGIPAKLIVVGMLANPFSIADPNDAGMLDVVGFDSVSPNIMSDFARQ